MVDDAERVLRRFADERVHVDERFAAGGPSQHGDQQVGVTAERRGQVRGVLVEAHVDVVAGRAQLIADSLERRAVLAVAAANRRQPILTHARTHRRTRLTHAHTDGTLIAVLKNTFIVPFIIILGTLSFNIVGAHCPRRQAVT